MIGLRLMLAAAAAAAAAGTAQAQRAAPQPPVPSPWAFAVAAEWDPVFLDQRNGSHIDSSGPNFQIEARYFIDPVARTTFLYGRTFLFTDGQDLYPTLAAGAYHISGGAGFWGEARYGLSPIRGVSDKLTLLTGIDGFFGGGFALGPYAKFTHGITSGLDYLGGGARLSYTAPGSHFTPYVGADYVGKIAGATATVGATVGYAGVKYRF
jgi:hypothetical protein